MNKEHEYIVSRAQVHSAVAAWVKRCPPQLDLKPFTAALICAASSDASDFDLRRRTEYAMSSVFSCGIALTGPSPEDTAYYHLYKKSQCVGIEGGHGDFWGFTKGIDPAPYNEQEKLAVPEMACPKKLGVLDELEELAQRVPEGMDPEAFQATLVRGARHGVSNAFLALTTPECRDHSVWKEQYEIVLREITANVPDAAPLENA